MIHDSVERVPTTAKLTDMQFVVAVMLGMNKNYYQIATELHIERATAKYHAEEAAKKVPGDLPIQAKLAAWARGASLDILEGRTLKFVVMSVAEPRRGSPPVADGAIVSTG